MKKMMKKIGMSTALLLMVCFSVLMVKTEAQAKPGAKADDVIEAGIYADTIELSGCTSEEAKQKIQNYVDSLQGVNITLKTVNDNSVTVTAADLGMKWSNTDIVDEAIGLGKEGNIVQRYKALKDLAYTNQVYPIQFEFDKDAITAVLTEHCQVYDVEPIDMTLTRQDGVFNVIEGQTGYVLNVDASYNEINNYLTTEWNHGDASIDLIVDVEEPKGSAEELAKVKDVLGTYTTSYSTSGSSRSANVANGCRLINGMTLYPGDSFSTLETITPFSEANGYFLAGSYLNGTVVESLGGGICQVSTTLYNAILRAELEVTERSCHSMIIGYVDPSEDAAISESGGKDFKFTNNLDYPVYIEGVTTPDKKITFTVYGVETRPENRTVSYQSEVLQTINPESEVINQDGGQPIGYITVQSVHIGYKAKLWKIVTENGVETSRTEVNTSSYKMVPRTAVVGTATDNPDAYNQLQAAIASGSIDVVKGTVAALTATPAAPEAADTQVDPAQ